MGDLQQETGPEAVDAPPPSLLHRLRPRRRDPSTASARWLRIAAGAVLVALALVMIVAGVLGNRARREAVTLGETVARAGAAREADRNGAALFADSGLTEELAAIGAHLPPGIRLASAGRDENGALSFAIDSADPDALRETLRGDPFFQAFHERGQTAGEDGHLRVRFERMP